MFFYSKQHTAGQLYMMLDTRGLSCAVVSLKTGHLDWVRDYMFHVKPVCPFPPLRPTTYTWDGSFINHSGIVWTIL